MYVHNLSFIILSNDDCIEATLTKITALEDCIYSFKTVTEDLLSVVNYTPDTQLIVDCCTVSWDTLHLPIDVKPIFVLTSDHLGKMSNYYMEMAQGFWVMDGKDYHNEALLKTYFNQLAESCKMKADYRKQSICFDTAINSIPDLVWFKDDIGTHLIVNNGFCEAVRKTKEQIYKRGHYYIWDLTPEEYAKGEFVCLESETEVMQARRTCLFDENVLTKYGMREFKTYKSPLIDKDGTIFGTCGLAHDVTQEHIYEKQLQQYANTDFLTGCNNRRSLTAYAEKLPDNLDVALAILDLDYFKNVNDTYGHEVGDLALKLTAKMMQAVFPEDFVVRYGGDEFLVISTAFPTKEAFHTKILEMMEAIKEAFRKHEELENLTCSVGFFFAQADSKHMHRLDRLIYLADMALYKGKEMGKDRAISYTEVK